MTTTNGQVLSPDRGTTSADEMRYVGYATPVTDIVETPEAYVVMLDMPGATRQTLSLWVEDGSLEITAALPEGHTEHETLVHSEHSARGFRRTLVLGDGIDLESIDAQLEHGVLTVKVLKSESAKPKEITIR